MMKALKLQTGKQLTRNPQPVTRDLFKYRQKYPAAIDEPITPATFGPMA
jgi:hypothetical protein